MQRVIRDTSPSQDDPALLEQGAALIAKHFPPSVAHLFATPRGGQDGVHEWWTELQGQPQRFQDLTKDQQTALLDVYEQRQGALHQLVGELRGRGLEQDAATVQRMIGPAKPEHLFSINGQPLIIRWSEPQPVPPPPPPPIVEPVAPPVRPRRWIWLPWFLLPLLALLLLALLLWFGWPWLMRWFNPQPPVIEPPVVTAPAPEPAPEPELFPAPVPEPVPEPVPPPPPAPAPAPVPSPAPPAKAACARPEKEEPPEFTVVLDTSGSMILNVEATWDDEQWFFGFLNNQLPADDRRLTRITKVPLRIDVAKRGLKQLINDLDSTVDMRLVTFDGCRAPIDHGVFTPPERPTLVKNIQRLQADDGTALAASLEVAARRMDGRNRDGVIVMFVDGPDGCERNVCKVAEKIALKQPRLKVNLVNISRTTEVNCVAEVTGGRVYTGENAEQVAKAIEQASREVTTASNCTQE